MTLNCLTGSLKNLLASYNPETATTARKVTGSYYTPREIVDYMVNESLKEYFKVKVPDIDEDSGKPKKELRSLIDASLVDSGKKVELQNLLSSMRKFL